MSDIRTIFNDINNIIGNSQLGNYRPPRIYTDPNEIKYAKQKAENGYKRDKPTKKIDMNCKKGTFLDYIEKRQAKMPSPNSYKPQNYQPSYKKRAISNYPQRTTFLSIVEKEGKKHPIPSAGDFDLSKKKSSSSGKFDKSQNTTYLQAAACNAAHLPGVGEYNMKRIVLDRFGKWDKALRQSISKQNKSPTSTTYEPKYHDRNLFSQINKTKLHISNFGKQKRFNENKEKNANKNLFYTGISEWGLKTNCKKKDILTNLSNFNTYSKSVYYG